MPQFSVGIVVIASETPGQPPKHIYWTSPYPASSHQDAVTQGHRVLKAVASTAGAKVVSRREWLKAINEFSDLEQRVYQVSERDGGSWSVHKEVRASSPYEAIEDHNATLPECRSPRLYQARLVEKAPVKPNPQKKAVREITNLEAILTRKIRSSISEENQV